MTEKIDIPISKELKQKLEERIKQTNFKSIQDYFLFILKQIVADKEANNEKVAYTKKEEEDIRGNQAWYNKEEGKQAYSEEEEADLKKNLEDLGYL